MPPKIFSDDKKQIVIRPLSYVRKKSLFTLASNKKFPIASCSLYGSQENIQWQKIKKLIVECGKSNPNRTKSMFNALFNANNSHLLVRKVFGF